MAPSNRQILIALLLTVRSAAVVAGSGADPLIESRQRYINTVVRMKVIADACLNYNTDNNHFPAGDTLEELQRALIPEYLPQGTAMADGWGKPFRYHASNQVEMRPGKPWMAQNCGEGTDSAECQTPTVMSTEVINHTEMTLVSAGDDGRWEHQQMADYVSGWTHGPEEDLVIRDGEWLRRMKPLPENTREAMRETRRTLSTIVEAMRQFQDGYNRLPDANSLPDLLEKLGSSTLPPNFKPNEDAWGTALRFAHWSTPGKKQGEPPESHYRIASAGADGRFEQEDLQSYHPREFSDEREDLVVEDSMFVSDFLARDTPDQDRSRRTMVKIKSVATALESLATDHQGRYPDARDMHALLELLVAYPIPYFQHDLLLIDGWGHSIRYASWNEVERKIADYDHYCIASPGADGKFEHWELKLYSTQSKPTDVQQSDDIVVCDGQFVRQPTE